MVTVPRMVVWVEKTEEDAVGVVSSEWVHWDAAEAVSASSGIQSYHAH